MSAYLRALSMVAPSLALRILQAQIVLRGYDGAQQGRRVASFRPGAGSANAELSRALAPLRARSRELVRNTFIGTRAISVLSTHIVGTDLTVRFRTGSTRLDRVVQSLWDEWASVCDIEGEGVLTGLLTLATRAALEGGDSLVRMVDRPLSDSRPVPLALHVAEGDLIDETRDAGLALSGASRARLGVELGAFDERLGYWLHDIAPGEPGRLNLGQRSRLVPRAEVCHLYRRLRPGQVRGVPLFAPVLMPARDYADLVDAVVVKERMQAAIGLIIKTDSSSSNIAAAADLKDDGGRGIEALRPGMVHRLKSGEDALTFAPAGNSSFEPVSRGCLMGIAAGTGLTYHQLTGDLTQANYSSLRAGLLEFRREIADWQWHTLVPQTLHRIVRRWIERAILSGRLRQRVEGYSYDLVMPAIEPVDPKKDLEADILAVRAGRMSPQDFIGSWGRDWRQVVDEYADFLGLLDEKNLVLDIDARHRARTGQATTDSPALAATETQQDQTP